MVETMGWGSRRRGERFLEKRHTDTFDTAQLAKCRRRPGAMPQHLGEQGQPHGNHTAVGTGELPHGRLKEPVLSRIGSR
jgi:hypothetical protein